MRYARSLKLPIVVVLALGWLVACAPKAGPPAEVLFKNGAIYTADARGSRVEALAIRDGRIVWTGPTGEADRLIGPTTRVIDLEGRLVLPGFIDSHCHPNGAAEPLFDVMLYGLDTLEAYQKAVGDFARSHPGSKAIRGSGWRNPLFPPTGPDRAALDALVKDIPVALSSEDGHSTWVNTKTLELAGITERTPDPPGGVIERDPRTGRLTGTLREKAAGLVAKIIPEYTVEELEQGYEAYQGMALSLGITTTHDASVDADGSELKAYQNLAKNGRLRMRFRASLYVDPAQGPDQSALLAAAREAVKDPLFQANGAKIFIDGVVEGGTAFLLEPYAHRPGFRGDPLWAPEALAKVCAALVRDGFQLHFHTIGDAAVAMALDAVAAAAAAAGKPAPRSLLTHLQLVAPRDIVRFLELGAVAVPQPYWFIKDDYYHKIQVPYLGRERADREYPMKSFLSAGAVAASSSDFPVTIPCDPLQAIQIGVTRTIPGTTDPGEVLWPDERVTLEEMIGSFTRAGAYANFLEGETGSLEAGRSADLIVLDRNLFESKPEDISKARVLLTFFAGREAFREKSYTPKTAAGR